MFPSDIENLATELLTACRNKGWKLATAESCTGGLIGAVLTEIPGSSDVVDRGFITYSNDAKISLLDVQENLFPSVGAVSPEVAREMALGTLANSMADITVAVTGVAGPGASESKPAGLVYIACAIKGGECVVKKNNFTGNRTEVRLATVSESLQMALEQIER